MEAHQALARWWWLLADLEALAVLPSCLRRSWARPIRRLPPQAATSPAEKAPKAIMDSSFQRRSLSEERAARRTLAAVGLVAAAPLVALPHRPGPAAAAPGPSPTQRHAQAVPEPTESSSSTNTPEDRRESNNEDVASATSLPRRRNQGKA